MTSKQTLISTVMWSSEMVARSNSLWREGGPLSQFLVGILPLPSPPPHPILGQTINR